MYQFQSTFRYFGDFIAEIDAWEWELFNADLKKLWSWSRIKQQYQDGYEAKIDATIELYKP